MKIGIIKEGKTPPDERVPFSPEQCKEILTNFSDIELVVQKSKVRRFKDKEYTAQGIQVTDDVSDCDVLLGVKEVPIDNLIPNKTYFFFSHTIKKQPYNRNLLLALLEKNISMVDYETLTSKKGNRLIGYGNYAGIVGAYNTFYAYGKRTKTFDLKRAYLCNDRVEMEGELSKIKLPKDYKIVLTGGGRVASGALEILNKLNIKKVSPSTILAESFNQPVYAQLTVKDYVERKNLSEWETSDFFQNPREYQSSFMPFAEVADMYIACHYWDAKAPYLFTRNDVKSSNFKIRVIGDISCDIDGPVASTIRPSTITEPIYGYHPVSESEVSYVDENIITVMAVDNLPCELPKDASAGFGRDFIDFILPHILNDKNEVIENATICKNGDLTPKYEYLRGYVNGAVEA